ncbi:MAG: radical SAM family heme chaperone HemW [Deferrisomatales bacterium]
MALSVYVHVPFCRSRCRYCAFYSGEPMDRLERYGGWIQREAALRRVAGWVGPVATVYFGGGTPSLLPVGDVAAVLETIDRLWGLGSRAEISLEANPSPEPDWVGLRAAGVTRVSVGVQALDERILAALGRSHDSRQARQALQGAVRAGFRRVGADLLFGVPGLSPPALARWVGELADRGVGHLSAYSLELHPGTPLHREFAEGEGVGVPEAVEAAQWEALVQAVARAGFRPYELSNFALPGHRCAHNLRYWNGQPYLGLGPGAHSFAPGRGRWGTRSWNDPGLRGYVAHLGRDTAPPGGSETLTRKEALLEFLFLWLRRAVSLRPESLAERFALDPLEVEGALRQLAGHGLLRRRASGSYRPTPDAWRRADGLAVTLHGALRSPPGRLDSARGRCYRTALALSGREC